MQTKDFTGVLAKLSAKFDPSVVKSREGGGGKTLLYLSIDSVINRINETLPNLEDVTIIIADRFESGPYKVQKKYKGDDGWKTVDVEQRAVTIVVHMQIGESVRDGIGSDELFEFRYNKYDKAMETTLDVDKAWKTAYANAIKKAADKFGIGTYLWDAEERAKIENGTAEEEEAPPAKLDTKNLDLLKAKMKEMGFSTGDFESAVRDFATKVLGKAKAAGLPGDLVGTDQGKTDTNVQGLMNYLDNLKKR
jgi:hypothetical protein